MASRFLKAAIPQAQSVYTPLPLEIINQQLATDQLKYDTAENQLATTYGLNQQVAPWNKGEELNLINKYIPQIDILAKQLHDSGDVSQVVPALSKLNQQWLNDEERKRLQAGFDWYEAVEKKRQQEEGYNTAYNELIDPLTGQYRRDINNFDLNKYAYIKSDSDKWLNEQLDNLKASTIENLNQQGIRTFQDPNTGAWMYQEPGSNTTEILDMSNPYVKNALNQLTESIISGENDPAKWYKGKYVNPQKIADRVYELASPRFYSKNTLQIGNQGFLPEGFQTSGSGNTKSGDFVYTILPIGLGEVGPETYLNIAENVGAYNEQQLLLEQDILKQSGDIINSFSDSNSNNPLKDRLLKEANIKGLNSIDALRQGLAITQEYYNSLPENSEERLKLQGQITRIGDNIKAYDRISLNKEFLDDYKNHIDTEIAGKYINNSSNLKKVDSFIDGTLSDSFINSLDDIDVKRTKKSSDITLQEKGELVNLIKQYENNGRYLNKNNEVIEDRILNLLGIESSGDKTPILGSIFSQLEGVQGYDNLASSINNFTKDPSVYTGIKFNPNRLSITKDAALDTNIEEWNEGLNNAYKDGTIESIAGGLNMPLEDFIKSAISFDGKKLPNVTQLKDYKFDNIEMVDIGSVPQAMYTFSKEGKGKFSVVAPLTATNNKVIIQDAAIDLWNKGLGKDQTAMNMAARMMATSALDEDQYSQLLYMFKLNQPDNIKPFTLNIKNLPIQVSKVGQDQYSIQVTNSQGQTNSIVVNGEEDVLTAIGTTALNSLSSGGNSGGKGVILEW